MKTKGKKRSDWQDGYVKWQEGNHIYLSVVFSWLKEKATQDAELLRGWGYQVSIGGPAMKSEVNSCEVVTRHNPNATFTSRGCIRKCSFCLVPKVEGDIQELQNWEPRSLVCDNNLLACSRAHFNNVIDRLKPLPEIDFNQGLDARLLKPYHASRLAELNLKCVRLAWDGIEGEQAFRDAVGALRAAKIPKSKIRAYILIGFKDTPEDALYRLQETFKLGILPNPMRYQSIDTLEKNSDVSAPWTHSELSRYMRYWANLIHTSGIPFEEFRS